MQKLFLSIGLAGVSALAVCTFTSGCFIEKVSTVTPGGTNDQGVVFASVTNTVTVVNTNNLELECAGLELVGTPAVTFAIQKDPNARPIVQDIQTAINGALNGADTNVVATIEGFLGQNQALDDQLTPLINAASNLRGRLLAKYGPTVAGQITTAILQADLDVVTAALAATAAQARPPK